MLDAAYELGPAAEDYPVRIRARGRSVLTNPMLNRGTAFTHAERRELGLEGLLASGVSTLMATCGACTHSTNDRLTTWPKRFPG